MHTVFHHMPDLVMQRIHRELGIRGRVDEDQFRLSIGDGPHSPGRAANLVRGPPVGREDTLERGNVRSLLIYKDAFHTLICRKQEAALDGWLETAAASLLASFARGLARDHHAVRDAISSAWSNAQAEGQINKLKLVKCQMYGRGNLDLLQARVIATGR